MHQVADDHLVHHAFSRELLSPVVAALGRSGAGLIQAHDIRTRRFFQHKLVIRERAVDVRLQNVEEDVVVLPRPLDLNLARELDPTVILEFLVARVGDDVALLVINPLPVGRRSVRLNSILRDRNQPFGPRRMTAT